MYKSISCKCFGYSVNSLIIKSYHVSKDIILFPRKTCKFFICECLLNSEDVIYSTKYFNVFNLAFLTLHQKYDTIFLELKDKGGLHDEEKSVLSVVPIVSAGSGICIVYQWCIYWWGDVGGQPFDQCGIFVGHRYYVSYFCSQFCHMSEHMRLDDDEFGIPKQLYQCFVQFL